jgi:sarcosine oxidase subunit alpha
VKTTDVAVVGAGPAGVAAALAAASAGARTTLIDEQPSVGGNLRWRTEIIGGLPLRFDDQNGDRAFQVAGALGSYLKQANVEVVTNGTAWGWFEPNTLGVVANGESYELEAKSIVVASGSTDIMAPFAGSTLPGVMTARAVMIFLHLHRVLPGRRFAIIGEGADAIEVSHAIEAAGAEVVCRVKSVDDVRVTGERELRQFESPDDSYDVDTVVVALGRQPDPELALHALAQNVYAASAGGIVPRRNELCETSTPGVYVAGEAAGVCGVGEAMAEGWLAGLAAAGAAEEAVNAARAELDSTRDVSRKNIVDELRLKVAAF